MNITPLIHAAIAVAAYLAFGLPGGVGACIWWVAREHTQAEYRWIETYGQGLRANMPFFGGFDMRVWRKVDPWLDMLVPTVAVTVAHFWPVLAGFLPQDLYTWSQSRA